MSKREGVEQSMPQSRLSLGGPTASMPGETFPGVDEKE
ncbi:hypothetical protein ACP_3348 [Acidobacterium capsulatum ATCC 51196]|uniref:Uncharacterized protein n=1 Tax=Acidobacterium capsulatum (strain ATCC 51196 / DSM 11244 / BCRC 80197 / JCM 7670 / NBRC 15755 / NCIMB 13165 / 161) TaxID=240015 RepID=C1F6B7_ACIC5|nr:hypothetical protein ACP_3348 [Acidobacterium capsulatum ATCC 51196]